MSVLGTASLAYKIQKWYTERNTALFEKERDEQFRNWVVELVRLIREIEQRLGDDSAKLATLFEDSEFRGVFRNLGYEAAREAITERRRMLAYAASGALESSLTIAEKARAERSLRELDPDDIDWLAAIAEARFADGDPREGAARGAVFNASASRDVLMAAGCIYEPNVWGRGVAEITRIGKLILAIMSTYVATRRSDFLVNHGNAISEALDRGRRQLMPRQVAQALERVEHHEGWEAGDRRKVTTLLRAIDSDAQYGQLLLMLQLAEKDSRGEQAAPYLGVTLYADDRIKITRFESTPGGTKAASENEYRGFPDGKTIGQSLAANDLADSVAGGVRLRRDLIERVRAMLYHPAPPPKL